MNKKRYITIFVLILLVALALLGLSKANPTSKPSYKNMSYTGENEKWSVSLEVRDKQVDINVIPKDKIDQDSQIQCNFKTGAENTSSGVISYGKTIKKFVASVSLVEDPINYENQTFTIKYNNKESQITLTSMKK